MMLVYTRLVTYVFIIIVVLVFGQLFVSSFWLVNFKSYDEFIEWFAYLIGKPYLINSIPKFFTLNRFFLLRIIVDFLAVIYVVGLMFFIYKRHHFVKSVSDFFSRLSIIIWDFFRFNIPELKIDKVVVFAIILCAGIRAGFNIFTIPISLDESVSYIDFISKGPLVTGTFYHTVNNHIFYNHTAYVVSLFLPDGEVAQRIILLPVFIVSCFLLYVLIRKSLGSEAAIIGLSFFAFSPAAFLFSFLARGYMFLIFFTLIACLSFYGLMFNNKKRYWISLSAVSVLGVYTIPAYGYFIAASYSFWFIIYLIYSKRKVKPLIISSVVVFILIAILYLPPVIVSGLGGLRAVVKGIGTSVNAGELFKNNISLLTEFYIGGGIYFRALILSAICAGVLFTILRNKQGNAFSSYLLWLLIFPFLVTLVFKQRMFDRTWVYLTVPFTWFGSYLFIRLRQKRIVVFVACCVSVLQFLVSNRSSYFEEQQYHMLAAKKAADTIIKEKIERIFIEHRFFRPLIEYHLTVNRYYPELDIAGSSFRPVNFDSSKKYDMIICTDETRMPSLADKYIMLDSIKELRIYKLIK